MQSHNNVIRKGTLSHSLVHLPDVSTLYVVLYKAILEYLLDTRDPVPSEERPLGRPGACLIHAQLVAGAKTSQTCRPNAWLRPLVGVQRS